MAITKKIMENVHSIKTNDAAVHGKSFFFLNKRRTNRKLCSEYKRLHELI